MSTGHEVKAADLEVSRLGASFSSATPNSLDKSLPLSEPHL